MSMVTQLISAVIATERQIDDQVMKLNSFGQQIDQAKQQVAATLGGSTKAYDQKMNSQLDLTKQQLDTTLGQLQSAKTALQQMRMI